MESQNLSMIRLQHDWLDAVNDPQPNESIWVSLSGESHRFPVPPHRPAAAFHLSPDATSPFQLALDGRAMSVSHSASNTQHRFVAASHAAAHQDDRYLSLSLTLNQQHLATAGEDGVVSVWPTRGFLPLRSKDKQDHETELSPTAPTVPTASMDDAFSTALLFPPDLFPRQFTGHVGDVYLAKWFPSDQVLLTAGADCCLNIYDAFRVPKPAVRLVGHEGGVLDADFIDRGKRILSCSRDGTIRCWDTPTQAVVSSAGEREEGQSVVACRAIDDAVVLGLHHTRGLQVYDLRVGDVPVQEFIPEEDQQPLSLEQLENHPSSSSSLSSNELQNQELIQQHHNSEEKLKTPIYTCLEMSQGDPLCAVGTESGVASWIDRRNGMQCVRSLTLDGGAITRIRKDVQDDLRYWVSTFQGVLVQINTNNPHITTSLSGADLEPVFDFVQANDQSIISTSRDRKIRRYLIQ